MIDTCRIACALEVNKVKTKNKKQKAKPRCIANTPLNHCGRATAVNSNRRSVERVPPVCFGQVASVDAGFVKVGHRHLSQSTIDLKPR